MFGIVSLLSRSLDHRWAPWNPESPRSAFWNYTGRQHHESPRRARPVAARCGPHFVAVLASPLRIERAAPFSPTRPQPRPPQPTPSVAPLLQSSLARRCLVTGTRQRAPPQPHGPARPCGAPTGKGRSVQLLDLVEWKGEARSPSLSRRYPNAVRISGSATASGPRAFGAFQSIAAVTTARSGLRAFGAKPYVSPLDARPSCVDCKT